MKKNRGLGFILMAILLIACTLVSVFSLTFFNDYGAIALKIPGMNDIRLGIDIRGGVDAVFEPDASAKNVTNEELDHARSIIELRLDKNNITDRDVTADYSKHRILVRFPWKSTETNFNPEEALEELGQMGKLTFKDPDGKVILEGTEVAKSYDDTVSGKNVVQLEFNASGSKKFAEATAKLVNQKIAIYLDNEMISNPVVNTVIADGKCYIDGMTDKAEAKKLANLIASGSLPFKLTCSSNNSISPTLGRSALDMMTLSGLIAFIIVCLFMIFVYRAPGVVACFALLGQVVGQLLTLSISQFTLTLPGIAGIILSIGMGVDANVISAERIKEEIYAGKTIRAAIDTGYHKAFAAVADGNVTVGIVAILLWMLGTGPMISFGFTLLIGVIFNFVCGVGVSKIMLRSITGLKFLQKKSLFGFNEKTQKLKTFNFNFFGKRNVFFMLSIGLFLVGMVMIFINGISMDIQFKGGSILKYSYEGQLDKETVASEAGKILGIDVDVQETSDFTGNNKQIVLNIAGDNALTLDKQKAFYNELKTKLPSNNLKISETYNVNPFYGREFFEKGLLAIGLAAIFILIYVWIRFKSIHGLSAGAMALVALLHDCLMVFVSFIVFRIPINDAFIAVVLTIIGYSINDTIVIYDRIRENQRLFGKKISLGDLINLSQNQCFTRTLNTSMNTFFSMLVVVVVSVIFNLTSIKNFAIPMMVGIISGCYSTLFLACPLWVLWNTRKGKNQPLPEKAGAKKLVAEALPAAALPEQASAKPKTKKKKKK